MRSIRAEDKVSVAELRKRLQYHGVIFTAFQSAFTCSKLTIEALEQDVKYVQS